MFKTKHRNIQYTRGSYDYARALSKMPATKGYSKAFVSLIERLMMEAYKGQITLSNKTECKGKSFVNHDITFNGSIRSPFLDYLTTEKIDISHPVFVVGNYKNDNHPGFEASIARAFKKEDPLIFLVLRDEIRESDHLDIGEHFVSKESLIVSVSDRDLIALADSLKKEPLSIDDLIFFRRASQTVITGQEYLW
jgi:hypothetical protein